MNRQAVAIGEAFHKAGRPRIVWIVEQFTTNVRLTHAVLARADDPTTKITIACGALSNALYFRRSASIPAEKPCPL